MIMHLHKAFWAISVDEAAWNSVSAAHLESLIRWTSADLPESVSRKPLTCTPVADVCRAVSVKHGGGRVYRTQIRGPETQRDRGSHLRF